MGWNPLRGPNQASADCRRMRSTAENAGLRRRAGEPHWQSSATLGSNGDPQIRPWAESPLLGFDQPDPPRPEAWPCHTATCAPAAQSLKLADFQVCCLRDDPLEKPRPTILALTAAHNGVAVSMRREASVAAGSSVVLYFTAVKAAKYPRGVMPSR